MFIDILNTRYLKLDSRAYFIWRKVQAKILILCFHASQYKSNETPTWCKTVQVLFLQGHSTCFGHKRPSSGVFKTSTAATGTCVIVAGQSSHLLIRAVAALIRRCDDLLATITHVPMAAVLVLNTPDDGHLRPKHVGWPCRNKTCTVLHQAGVSFDLYYDARKHKIKNK